MFARPSWLIAFLAIAAPGLNAQPSAGYYDSALGKTGVVLRLALHNVIKGHTVIPYSSVGVDVVDALSALDEDPLNTNNVILIYSRRSEGKTNFNVTGGWNREHLWPNSYGIDSRGPAYSDLHHLRPEDENVNSARGNKFFDLSNTNDVNYRRPGHAEAPSTSTDTDSWEPPDAVKDDIGLFSHTPNGVASTPERRSATTPLGLMMISIHVPRAARASQPLYVDFHLPCSVSAEQEDGAVLPPAGGRTAAPTRSFNPRTSESAAQLDPSALLRPELEPLPERPRFTAKVSSYPQE